MLGETQSTLVQYSRCCSYTPTYEGVGRREASRKVKYRGTQVAEERIFKTGIEGPVKSRESGLTDQRVNRIVRGCWVRGD